MVKKVMIAAMVPTIAFLGFYILWRKTSVCSKLCTGDSFEMKIEWTQSFVEGAATVTVRNTGSSVIVFAPDAVISTRTKTLSLYHVGLKSRPPTLDEVRFLKPSDSLTFRVPTVTISNADFKSERITIYVSDVNESIQNGLKGLQTYLPLLAEVRRQHAVSLSMNCTVVPFGD